MTTLNINSLLTNIVFTNYVIRIAQKSIKLLWLLLLINSCNCFLRNQPIEKIGGGAVKEPSGKPGDKPGNPPNIVQIEDDEIKKDKEIQENEIILFVGNPGTGKSTLCNSIFQRVVFKSGTSIGKGMTIYKEEHSYDNKLYIDTPGLDDVEMCKQAAKEITKALKYNNNYKIAFVATLEAGKMKPADLVSINLICDAIKVDFEYGIILNKVTKVMVEKIAHIGSVAEVFNSYLSSLHKKPASMVILEKINDIQDKDNIYFPEDHENRQKLLSFLDNLKPSRIDKHEVKEIDVRDYNAKIQDMETAFKEKINKIQGILQEQTNIIKRVVAKANNKTAP